MLKRNKLSIFLLLVVVGLTIYYVSNPQNETPVLGSDIIETRYQQYAQMRMDVLASRNEEINNCELIISSVSSSDDFVKLEAIEKMNSLIELTEREVALENQIKILGYNDCLVHQYSDRVDVNILANDFTVDEYIDIALIIKEEFGNDYTISVSINTVEENS